MKVCSCPDELPAPEIDFSNYDSAKEQAAEDAHKAALKAWLIAKGYKGKHTGEEFSMPMADGAARYMFADGGRSSVLIHLPYGDAWDHHDAQHIPKTEVLKRIANSKAMASIFASKKAG